MFRACSVRSFGYYWVDPRNVTYPDTQCMVYLPRVGKWRFGRCFFMFEGVIVSFHVKFPGSRYQPKTYSNIFKLSHLFQSIILGIYYISFRGVPSSSKLVPPKNKEQEKWPNQKMVTPPKTKMTIKTPT